MSRGANLRWLCLTACAACGTCWSLGPLATRDRPTDATSARPTPQESHSQPLHVKIDGTWYDVSDWVDRHPGGRYVLEWADGHDVTGAFHTIHLFGSKKAREVLRHLPEADLSSRATEPRVLPQVVNVAVEQQQTGSMDSFMLAGEELVRLSSPPAPELLARSRKPVPPPVSSASGLAWQRQPQAQRPRRP